MRKIAVRPITMADCAAISRIHRGENDPWNDYNECQAWISRRLKRGFYMQAATYDERIVGHGEWVISNEPQERSLYLGILHIDPEFRRQGLGRAMLTDGLRHAQIHDCNIVRTIPDTDTGSEAFYAKCGFVKGRNILSCKLPTAANTVITPAVSIQGVPYDVIKNRTFVFGLAQAASRHMWEIANAPPDTDRRLTPAIVKDGAYIQLAYYAGNDTGLALCWNSSFSENDLINHALDFGHSCGLKYITFLFYQDRESACAEHETTIDNYEMTLNV